MKIINYEVNIIILFGRIKQKSIDIIIEILDIDNIRIDDSAGDIILKNIGGDIRLNNISGQVKSYVN